LLSGIAYLEQEVNMEIIEPAEFNERFTLYLNAKGEPVQRALRTMTANEVLLAFAWTRDQAARCEREAEPAEALAVAIEENRWEALADQTGQSMCFAGELLRAKAKAFDHHAQLLRLIQAAMPQWQEHNDKGLHEALRRYWPGGRAA
jgi:hypothetical protein